VEFLSPGTFSEALAFKAAFPGAVPIAGGTDVMVEVNFDHRRPSALLNLNRIAELHSHSEVDGRIRIGACMPYTRIITDEALRDSLIRRFGDLVAQAASPIDDVRGTADYRKHALSVMARRTLGWAWNDYRRSAQCA
jgi:CO/xanthine dehydrogenase FAD-binding subunit